VQAPVLVQAPELELEPGQELELVPASLQQVLEPVSSYRNGKGRSCQ
jgi:hypothetical protein